MTRFIMSLEEVVDRVLYVFENGENGDFFIMKAPACSIGLQAEAVCEMFGGNKENIKVIGIRHGEMYETLLHSRMKSVQRLSIFAGFIVFLLIIEVLTMINISRKVILKETH